jgi:hypothetical protein
MKPELNPNSLNFFRGRRFASDDGGRIARTCMHEKEYGDGDHCHDRERGKNPPNYVRKHARNPQPAFLGVTLADVGTSRAHARR